MSDIIHTQPAAESACKISMGSKVRLHFSLLLTNGKEIDSTRNSKPAEFICGDGQLLPGFEAALLGKQKGFAEQITIPAADAFGERNPANIQLLERN